MTDLTKSDWRGVVVLNVLKSSGEEEIFYRLPDGGLATSFRKLARRLHWAPKTVRETIEHLEALKVITVMRPKAGFSLIIYIDNPLGGTGATILGITHRLRPSTSSGSE